MKELVLYCDESISDGEFFSNFYGGALVSSKNLDKIVNILEQAKQKQNLFKEIKWTKLTEQYLNKYISVIDEFFDLIADNKIKVRIMFSQNAHVPKGLSKDQLDKRFFLLYYQFIKHAFGLRYCNFQEPTFLKIFFDLLPDKKDKCNEFKQYINKLQLTEEFLCSKIKIRSDDIGEVDSRDHVILQCVDIVLGSMQFRLNNLHKQKPDGCRYRGKRTIAKESLYNHILHRIREIYPGFNIGIETGLKGDIRNCWVQPYRHWKFVPNNSEYDDRLTKRKMPR